MQIENFLKYIDKLNEWVGRIVSYAVLFMVFTLCYEVFFRYLLNLPTIWVLEINQYVLCAYVALSGGYVMLYGSHVNVEILSEKFNPRTKALVSVITSVCFFTVVIALLWKSGVMALEAWETSEESYSMLAAPLFPAKVTVPIGAFLLLLQGIAKLIRDIRTLVQGPAPAPRA
ncbi:MAG: TRAP transporter small permease subunit [Desulfatitalea sp.]|nr:TRAP transporter small permease subunit [Desulfatitalea sp.]MBI5896486.1 TRAP transporter small permease subunit [Desulfobacterales bacterium]